MSQAKPSRVTVLAGGDAIQREAAIQKIARAAFEDGGAEIVRFDASERQTARAVEELLSFSMFSPNRVIVLDRLEGIPKKKDDSGGDDGERSKSDLDLVIDFIKNPRGDAPFVMAVDAEKSLPAALKKNLPSGALVKLEKTTAEKIRRAALKKCQDAGVEITPAALTVFIERCGDDAAAAQRELEKILLWAENGQVVDADDCKRLIETEDEEKVWEITGSIGRKDVKKALAMLHQLLEQGDHPLRILFTVTGHFRLLYAMRALQSDGVDKKEWPKRLGKPAWLIDKGLREAQKFSLDSLRASMRLLLQADMDEKGGKSDGVMVIERLVLDLCRLA
ncbi:MAG: DNA polymerase III subunit delta [bacterium]|nr:DNA polymerase III subunit delta [bacterium]